MIVFLALLFFSPLETNADEDFWVIPDTLAEGWQEETFLTIGFATAAIEFDTDGNLYTSDGDDFGTGVFDILMLSADSGYAVTSVYATYTTLAFGLNGLAFDNKGNLFISEFDSPKNNPVHQSGRIRKIDKSGRVSDAIVFPDYRPTGITAEKIGRLYFTGRKWIEPTWGNLYLIESFDKFDPTSEPSIAESGVVYTAIAKDVSGYLYFGTPPPDQSVYTFNPYTDELVRIARFNQYVEELCFDSQGNLYALEAKLGNDPSTIIKLIPPQIEIDGCNTGVMDWTFADDSTISEVIDDCAAMSASHDDFVSCVVEYVNGLMREKIISVDNMVPIINCAAQADIP